MESVLLKCRFAVTRAVARCGTRDQGEQVVTAHTEISAARRLGPRSRYGSPLWRTLEAPVTPRLRGASASAPTSRATPTSPPEPGPESPTLMNRPLSG